MRKAVTATLISLIIPSSAFGQSSTIPTHSNSATNRVAPVVDTPGSLRLPGALQLVDSREAFTTASTQTPSKRRNGHPVLIGAAIGAGAGYLINVTACRTGESVCSGAGDLMTAGIGAGIGALVGLLIARR